MIKAEQLIIGAKLARALGQAQDSSFFYTVAEELFKKMPIGHHENGELVLGEDGPARIKITVAFTRTQGALLADLTETVR